MRSPRHVLSISVVLLLFMALGSLGAARSASADNDGQTLYVNLNRPASPDGDSCKQPNYNHIQDAVNAAAAGDRIVVCDGTYTEQVTVPKSLDISGQGDAVIKAPSPMTSPKAIVRITGSATNASVTNLTITGPGGGPCDSIEYGIRVDGSANAVITDDHITEIQDTPFSGCQNGVAILVGRQAEGQTGTATISHNVIDKYQKNGPTVDNTGSHATIDHNTITGVGPTMVTAQNGVQVSRGANADVNHNTVSGNSYTGADSGCPAPCSEATGILPYQAGTATRIEHNTISANDNGVEVFTTSGLSLNHNEVRDSVADGVYFDSDTWGNTISHNNISHSGAPPVAFDAQDTSVGSGTAGTANTWDQNHCTTSNPAGLCGHGSNHAAAHAAARRTTAGEGGRRAKSSPVR